VVKGKAKSKPKRHRAQPKQKAQSAKPASHMATKQQATKIKATTERALKHGALCKAQSGSGSAAP